MMNENDMLEEPSAPMQPPLEGETMGEDYSSMLAPLGEVADNLYAEDPAAGEGYLEAPEPEGDPLVEFLGPQIAELVRLEVQRAIEAAKIDMKMMVREVLQKSFEPLAKHNEALRMKAAEAEKIKLMASLPRMSDPAIAEQVNATVARYNGMDLPTAYRLVISSLPAQDVAVAAVMPPPSPQAPSGPPSRVGRGSVSAWLNRRS